MKGAVSIIKLCIFDLDGTLLNTLSTISYFGNCALSYFGFDKIPENEYKSFVGDGADTLLRKMLTYSAKNDNDTQKVRKYYDKLYESSPSHLTQIYQGIPSLISNLLENNILLAVNSNKPDDMARAVISEIFPKQTFSLILGQREHIPKKPDPCAVFEILNTHDIQKDECVYIGDSEIDIQTAKNAGVTSIAATWGFRQSELLIKESPDYIIDSPLELLEIIKKFNKKTNSK